MRNRKIRPVVEQLESIESLSLYTVPVPLPNFPIQPVAPQVLPQFPVAPPQNNNIPPAPAPRIGIPVLFASSALAAHATQV